MTQRWEICIVFIIGGISLIIHLDLIQWSFDMTEDIYDDLGPFGSWSDLVDFYRSQLKDGHRWNNWLFRGMQDASWELKSSLERAVERVNKEGRYSGYHFEELEDGLLRRFKRQVHHYVSDVPKDDVWMEWQALMQHFGAPTRLLDWTYSFFVAAFFAVENMNPSQTCSIWAFDSIFWYQRAEKLLFHDEKVRDLIINDPNTKNSETVNAILLDNHIPLVFPINSDRLNERLAIQQGVFLAPSVVSKSFMENLEATAVGIDTKEHLLKINLTLSSTELEKAIRELNSMNINRATLFPGLDGFSSHFKNLLFMPEEIAPLGVRLRGPG